MPYANEPSSFYRRLLVGLALTATLALLVLQVPRILDAREFAQDDFREYWAAGRLLAQGDDPYSKEALHRIQKEGGSDAANEIMMWNPPWTLPLVLPFGLPGYPAARLLWLVFHICLVLWCADGIWRYYGGPVEFRWVPWLLALSFCPTVTVLRMGQIPPFMFLGLYGFLCCHRRREWWAGALIFLAAIKPHLVYLVGLALLVWALDHKRWRILLGGVLAGLAAMALSLLFDPQVIAHYQTALAGYGPVDFKTNTFGTLLRVWLDPSSRPLTYLPPLAGLCWFVPYYLKKRRDWNWDEQLPVVLMVSVITAAFGWLGDQVVLLLPLVRMAAWVAGTPSPPLGKGGLRRRLITLSLTVYLVLDVLDFVVNMTCGERQYWHLWTAPTLLAGYWILRDIVKVKGNVGRHAFADPSQRPGTLNHHGDSMEKPRPSGPTPSEVA